MEASAKNPNIVKALFVECHEFAKEYAANEWAGVSQKQEMRNCC